MISLSCFLKEKYQKYRLAKLLKKLDKPISIDLTSLRSKYGQNTTIKNKEINEHIEKLKFTIQISFIYDPSNHQLQVSHLELMKMQQLAQVQHQV